MKRFFAWVALLLGIASIVFFGVLPPIVEGRMNVVSGPQPPAATARAAALHKTLQVADMHADTLMWKRDFMERGTRGQVDFPRLAEGNVALQILSSVTKTPKNQNYDSNSGDTDNITLLTIAQGQPPRTWTSLVERSLWHSEKLHRFAAGSDGHRRIVQTKADLATMLKDRAAGKAVTGTMLSVEGLQDIEGKRANLDRIFNAGFRMAGLAHFFDNEVAGSMHGVRKGGLTPFGVEIVRAMEAKGMVVDIAHCSHTCVAQVLAMAKRPVVSSHGGVQATCKVNRNLTDEEIRGVAKTGGVVGIGYWDAAVCDTSPAGIVRAIAHVRDLVGIDHVGLGSDFDGAVTTRFDTTRLDAITQALIDAGFSDADIAKVMGGNVFRVLMQVLPA